MLVDRAKTFEKHTATGPQGELRCRALDRPPGRELARSVCHGGFEFSADRIDDEAGDVAGYATWFVGFDVDDPA